MPAEIHRNKSLSDPFAEEPHPKAFYFPSPEKKLSKNEKSVTISPSRRTDVVHRQFDDNYDTLNPLDEHFLQGSNIYRRKPVDSPDVDLDESWPTSERPSSVSLPGLDDSPVSTGYRDTVDRFLDLKKTLVFPEDTAPTDMKTTNKGRSLTKGQVTLTAPGKNSESRNVQSRIPRHNVGTTQNPAGVGRTKTKSSDDPSHEAGSVLQKYIERFRNSEPQSRDERTKNRESRSVDFWWLSTDNDPPTPSDSSTPKDREGVGKKSRRFTPLSSENLAKYDKQAGVKLKGQQRWTEAVPESPGDSRTRELQDRADRLLERSCSTVVSTDPAVSTEGIGSNVSSQGSVSVVLDEYSVRPKFAYFSDITDGQKAPVRKGLRGPVSVRQYDNDEDILHQWRLKRRMDHARSAIPVQAPPSFNFLSKNDQQKKVDTKLEEFKRKLSGKGVSTAAPCTPAIDLSFTPAPARSQPDTLPMSGHCKSQQHRPTDQSEPVIASPLLRRKVSNSNTEVKSQTEVNPHLHLMCDLVPCPHQGMYLQKFSNLRLSSEGLEGDPGEEGCSGVKDRPQYKQFLQAEKPDVERPGSGQSDNVGREFDNVERQSENVGRQSENVGRQSDNVGRQSDSVGRQSDSVGRQSDNVGRQSDREKQIPSGRETTAPRRADPDNVQSTHREKRKDTKRNLDSQEQQSSSCSHRSVTFRDDPSDKVKVDKEVRRQAVKGRQDDGVVVPRPQPASSPKLDRRPVEATIGQVVKNRLFNLSTSTVLSSVESLPAVTSLELDKPASTQPRFSTLEQQSADLSVESDGEFEDDQLLGMLRKQRQQYEQQLQEIDAVLETLPEDR